MSFPVYLSTFVGRQTQLGEIKSLIRQKAIRLLTLTGPGGCGKTRLAYESLADSSGAFEDGVYWVELVGLSDPLAVPQSIAASLQVDLAPGQTPLEALTFFLQPRETLVVLDNCEHLLAACAHLVDALLRACPALHVLATSRQKLGVEGEQIWPVPPLSYPTDKSLSPEVLTRYDAVNLFAARAKLIHPTFEISPDNAPDLIHICQLLEGMPLAIELAASWVNVLDVAQMVARLENQLALLAQRGGFVDARHQSMRATIRWSHDLLSEAEKTLFRRLGVFAGGFSLEAAEAVCGGAPLDDRDIMGLMGQLIDQSLVVRERERGGGSRYRQLESIRRYAVEELQAAAEAGLLRDRHLAFFADLIQKAEPQLLGPDQKAWTDRLEADNDNLEAALAWACNRVSSSEAKALEQAIRLANGLFWFWSYTDRLETGRRWYATLVNVPGLDQATSAYADLIRRKATFTWLLGDYPAAQAQLQASLSVVQAGPLVVAHATLLLGITALHQGQAERAIHLIRRSEAPFRALGDRRGLIITLTNLGGAFLETGDLKAARAYAEQAVETARADKDLWGLGLALSGVADVTFKQGEVTEALQLMAEALDVLQQSGQRWLLAEATWRLATMWQAQGDFERAEKRFEQCFALARESGALQWQIAALESLGFSCLSRGNDQQAAGHFVEVLRLTPPQAFKQIQLHVFVGIIQLAARRQQWEQAATLWGALQRLKATYALPAHPEESPAWALLQTQAGSPRFSHWLQAGSETSWESASRLALEIAEGTQGQAIVVPSAFHLRLLALGPAEVYLQGRLLAASDWTFAKPKELLLYLVSNPPKSKEQIGLVFWPDASPSQLRASLRAALYHLRRALGQRDWILYEDGYYLFNRDLNFWYDVEAFEAGVAEAKDLAGHSPQQAIEKLEAAVALYRGDFLEGVANDEWGVLRREALRRTFLAALSALGRLYSREAAYGRAAEVFRALLNADPLLEEAHRELMRAYTLQGERGLALRHYQSLVELLQRELGVRPAPETTALYQALQQGSL